MACISLLEMLCADPWIVMLLFFLLRSLFLFFDNPILMMLILWLRILSSMVLMDCKAANIATTIIKAIILDDCAIIFRAI